MKKNILSLLLLIFACSAFGKSANSLIRHYKKMEGAKYENVTKAIKLEAKQEGTDSKTFAKIKKLEYVEVFLDNQQRKELHADIMDIKGYKNFYTEKNNTTSIFSKGWSPFHVIQYYGIEDKGIIKDGIIHIGMKDNAGDKSLIVHLIGEVSIEELVENVELISAF